MTPGGTSGGGRAGAAVGPRGGGGGAALGPGPPRGCILQGGCTAQTTARRKWSGRVAMTRTTVPGTNDQLRQSWRTTGDNVEKAVEPGYRGS
jgi:hypothetical protein